MVQSKLSATRTFDVRPDTIDFRDKMYTPTLNEVPVQIELDEYRQLKVPILDQGKEGACTGFGLATVANYLLRRRKRVPDAIAVSPRMIYEMARRYDEWPGENYSGSSARGAMKGWHKHGICGDECWPYQLKNKDNGLNDLRTSDALKRPLGAYYRVNHQDLVSMHSAMAEVGILYATCSVHAGWSSIKKDGIIHFSEKIVGGHAFAIVAYDQRGFWIQNSWGNDWGLKGFALITYDDWLINGTDIWVARLGAPVVMERGMSTAIAHSSSAAKSKAYSYADLRPHIVSLGNNGELQAGGNYGTSTYELQTIFTKDFKQVTQNWTKKRILLYAHGGLVSEAAAVQRLADYKTALIEAEVYPISFIWHTDGWTTITNILQDALRRRKPEGVLDSTKDFMLNRLDDALEPVARLLTGKLQWDEMKENAMKATVNKSGGIRLALQYIAKLATEFSNKFEIHLVAHSAGSILLAPLVQLLTSTDKIKDGPLKGARGMGLKVASCTLWAPACTVQLFKDFYLPSIKNKSVSRFALFALTDKAEQNDHCANIYHKSLLYLVSNAFESKARIPLLRDGIPILGMEKFIKADSDLQSLFKTAAADLVLAPNDALEGSPNHSTSSTHGDFDDDDATVKASLARILKITVERKEFVFNRSESSLRNTRHQLNESMHQ